MSILYANRGMVFEEIIKFSNEQYEARKIALIKKIATPWKVFRKGDHFEAVPDEDSTVDFIGKVKDRSIAFDAKETREETRFPLSNIAPHQVEFLRMWSNLGGESFFLINWLSHNVVKKASFDFVCEYWDKAIQGKGRKSIPYSAFQDVPTVKSSGGIALEYLQIYQ